MNKIITLLTGNKRKKIAFEQAIKGFDVDIEIEKPWLPEIQDNDTDSVAGFAAKYGANLLKKPVIKIDSGFFIEGLKGFPGVLVNSVDNQVGAERFFEILKNLKNRKAWIKISLAYCEPNKEPVIFNNKCEGIITKKQISLLDESFIDKLFIPYHNKNKNFRTMGQIRKEQPELLSEIWGDIELQFIKWFIDNF